MNPYQELIQRHSDRFKLNVTMVTNQIMTESSFNPNAKSPAGAIGLMQFMPATWEWAWSLMKSEGLVKKDYIPIITNPSDSIFAGCWYDKFLFEKYSEIPEKLERWKFALAAYNAGRGNINKMLEEARKACGQPASYSEWKQKGELPGIWQEWDFASRFLSLVTGKHAEETIGYIRKIFVNVKI